MAKAIYIQKGEIIDFKNDGEKAIDYNEVVGLVNRIGVAAESIAVGAIGSLRTVGIYELPAVNDAAFALGDDLYWDKASEKLTKTSAGNIRAGWCVEAKAQAGTFARVKIG